MRFMGSSGHLAVGLLVKSSLGALMRLLVVDHVAELGCPDLAKKTAEELVSTPCFAVLHKFLREAQVPRVVPVLVSRPLDDFLEGLVGAVSRGI